MLLAEQQAVQRLVMVALVLHGLLIALYMLAVVVADFLAVRLERVVLVAVEMLVQMAEQQRKAAQPI
jgi:hypothetical protein